jgi:hypothetical protein
MGSGVYEWGKQCEGCCFCGPCVCLSIFLFCRRGCLCYGLQGLGLCKVGIVGSVGDECEGGRSSLVTG